MSRRPPPPAAAVLVALCLWTGCAGEELPEGTVGVNMYDNGYSPPVVRIPEGGQVVFRNLGRNQHHAIALDGSWSTDRSFGTRIMEQGDQAAVTFRDQGVYRYYCTYHGSPLGDRGMAGVVVVGDVPFDPGAGRRREPVRSASGGVRRVPQDFPRIQAAVDAAAPGDLILVDRGVYHEEVRVTTPSLVLRGVDRNEVVLDGDFVFGNGVLALADGVAIENLTARNYLLNGFYWTGVTGYRGSYLTAYNNGDYGLYAFDSVDGLMEQSYASGNPDSGFYIGQCYPCRAIIRDVVAENNALGYSGTNAGGDLYLVSSIWRHNMAGIVPNTLDIELGPPQRETTIRANLVADNNNLAAPAKPLAYPAFGNGILIAGGRRNLIEGNVIAGHAQHGVLLIPNRDARFWPASENVVRANRLSGSGRADLAVASPGTSGNCFAGNRFATASPPGLERFQDCGATRLPVGFDFVPIATALLRQRAAAGGAFPHGDWRTQPAPPPQPNLPGGAAAPVQPAVEVFAAARAGLAEARLPAAAAAYERRPSPRPGAIGALGRWAATLPLALWAAWTGLAAADLARRRDLGGRAHLAWAGAVGLLPILGAAAYLLAGRATVPSRLRVTALAGGLALYLLPLAAAALAGAGVGR